MCDVIAVECNKCKNLIKKEEIVEFDKLHICKKCFEKHNEYSFERRKLFEKIDRFENILRNYNCFIAGGAITSVFTNKEINDIDIYFRSKNDLRDFVTENKLFIVYATDKSFTFKVDDTIFQAIYFDYFEKAEDIFERFDFTVCMGAYDFLEDNFILYKDFLRHNSQKVLRVNTTTDYPIISALRVDKYKKKGYSISKGEFIKILMIINKLKIESFQDFKSHCGGMYGDNFDKAFESVENEDFDMNKALDKLDEIVVGKYEDREVDFKNLSYEEFVCSCIKDKVDTVAEIKDGFYINKYFKEFQIADESIHLYSVVSKEELFKFPLSFYKDVLKKDNKYFSFFKSSFEYKIGEEVIPSEKGIYCYPEINNNRQYRSYKDATLIELQIDSFDDINFNVYGGFTLKKCRFVGEV